MRVRGLSPWHGRVLIVVLSALTAIAMYHVPAGIAVFDERLRDGLLRIAARDTPETRLVVVDIDEASLAALGPWPWPRARLADLLEILLGPLQTRGVALDMVLPEAGDHADDARLAALAEHAPLTMAVALDYLPRHPPLAQGVAGNGWGGQVLSPAALATGYVGNHAAFAAARCVGNIGFVPDADGALRRLPAFSRLGERAYLTLSAALLDCAGIATTAMARLADDQGFWRLGFRRGEAAYTVVPAHRVLAEDVPRDVFFNRLVLVGSSALGLSDRVATPLAASTSGVMVHATSLSELLDAPSAPGVRHAQWLPAAWLAASFAAWLLLLPRLPPWGAIALLTGFGAGWYGLALVLIDQPLRLLPVLAAYAVLLVAGLGFEWWLSRRESRRVLRIFSHYVAPSVLAELLRHPGERPLTPRFREITVLNADMENYTQATDSLGLEEAARLTRDFLDALTRPVLAEEGTIDKYTGDGLVAFWNAPLPCADHADRAIRAARGILAHVSALNARRKAAGFPPVRVRVGIDSGLALVGDLGTDFRSAYTAVGNCINSAAKLQEHARHLTTDIVVGCQAGRRARNEPVTALGRHMIGGLTQAVELFTPTGARLPGPDLAPTLPAAGNS